MDPMRLGMTAGFLCSSVIEVLGSFPCCVLITFVQSTLFGLPILLLFYYYFFFNKCEQAKCFLNFLCPCSPLGAEALPCSAVQYHPSDKHLHLFRHFFLFFAHHHPPLRRTTLFLIRNRYTKRKFKQLRNTHPSAKTK